MGDVKIAPQEKKGITRTERTLRGIYQYIEKHPMDAAAYSDAFNAIRNIGLERAKNNDTSGLEEESSTRAEVDLVLTGELKRTLRHGVAQAKETADVGFMEQANELQRKILCFEGRESFDSFMLYNEINRPFDKQFWLPRRKILLPICHDLEALERGEIDELSISLPPRWSDVFPERTFANKDSKDLRIDIDKRKHYSSLTARSLYGSLNGTCDASGYQIMDDPHSGIEEALNRNRLDTAWKHVENDFMTRQSVEKIKRLWIGTRWSLYDVISRRIDALTNDPEFAGVVFKEISIPALDPETDESNFDYLYGKGKSTQSFRQIRSASSTGMNFLCMTWCTRTETSGSHSRRLLTSSRNTKLPPLP